MNRSRVFFILATFISFSAQATPAQVIIIRHAEKPVEGDTLSPKGYKRAAALVKFFSSNPIMSHYGAPASLYASFKEGKSVRSVETLKPTAAHFHLRINKDYEKDETDELAEEILEDPRNDGRTVIVAWQHSNIIPLIEELGIEDGPQEWPDSVFNRAIVIQFKNDEAVKYQVVKQCILPGDCK